MVVPVDDAIGRIQTGGDAHACRRAIGFTPEFVLPGPHQADGTSLDCPGDHRCVKAGVICSVLSVAARPFDMYTGDLRFREIEDRGDCAAQLEGALGMTPYRQVRPIPQRDGGGRGH